MRRPIAMVAGVALVGACAVRLVAQQPARPRVDRDDPSYQSQATAVLVDVIVRDGQNRPVLDLKADDFEIEEDGAPQTLGSFTLVSRGTGIGIAVKVREKESTTVITPTGGGAAKAEAPALDPPAVAIVFDAMSPEALGLCQEAALRSVAMSGETRAQVGVFATEPGVRVLQRFTNDPALVRAAVRKVQATGGGGGDVRAERLDLLRRRMSEMDALGLLSTDGVGGQGANSANSARIGQAEVQRRLIQGEMRMLQTFDDMDRDHRGYGVTNSLIAVLEAMAFMPGRKSMLLFSEGLPASPTLQGQLQSLVEAANRANITIYTVDGNGLRVKSNTEQTRREVDAVATERLRQATSGTDYTEGPLTKVLERTEDLLRYDGEGGLERLATDTGGFLVRGTNNLGSAFRRIDEDMRFHYLLTYSPTNAIVDGKFRTISVKVRRPGMTVYARKGYRAVRAPAGVPVMAYEAPALVLMDATPLPNAFPSQASAFVFPEPERPGLVPIVVRVTTDHLRMDQDDKGRYSAQAAVVVRVRDGAGQIVRKLSQQYVLTGDAKDVESAKKGEILFYRELDLPAGMYQVESMVYDTIAEKGSGRISTLVVPGAESPRLKMSSLVLVARTEQTAAASGAARTAPFYYGDTLLYPNVGEPLVRGRDEALSFYYVVYPVAGRCACKARIALLRNGTPIADTTSEIPTQEPKRFQHVGHLPIGDLPAGTYELRVTVGDSDEQQTRSAFFSVTD